MRWKTTHAIETLILSIFRENMNWRFRNEIVEVAHLLEKTMFAIAKNREEYHDYRSKTSHSVSSLIFKVKHCARVYAEKFARGNRSLSKYVPKLAVATTKAKRRGVAISISAVAA